MANCLDDWSSNKKVSCRWSYASMVAVFCTASHQYLYSVDFKVHGSYAIAFAYTWTSDDQFHVEQEVVVRQLLQAQVPLSFPVELYSTFLGYGPMVPDRIQCLSNLFTYDTCILWDQEITLSGRNGPIRVGWLTVGCYASMVALFCTASHQYLYCVDFNVDGSYAIAFANIRTNDDLILVLQKVAVRQLLQAQVPLSFPVELYSTFLGYGPMVPVWIQGLSNLFTYDTCILWDQETTLSGRNGPIRVGWLTLGCYASMVALFCTASHQYFYCVAFKVDGSCASAFACIRTSDDPSHVE